MALSATFVADFKSFNDAVDQSDVKLRTFEDNAGKVEKQLTRMSNSLTGTKLIQDATLMVEAVDRVGGVSKLTEKELARVGATAREAAEKLIAMGQDVPPGIQKIADESRKVETVHQSMIGTIKTVALGYLSMATARAAFNFVGKTVEEAAALKDLSTQTRINVEDLQLLSGAVSEFGIDTNELGNGLYGLSRKIAGGDDSVARGLHLMGLSLKDVEGLQGQELFLKIERGLATLQGGLRDTAASEIFGSKLGMAMAGAAEGIDEALAAQRRMNVVMGKDAVDELDKYDEAIEKAQKSLGAMAANLLGPVAEGFNKFVDLSGKAGVASTLWARFLDSFGSGTKHFDALGASVGVVNDQVTENTERTVENTKARSEATVAISEQEQAQRFMNALEADSAKALTETQRQNLEHLKAIGAANAANAAGVGVNAAQYAKWTEETRAAEEAHKLLEAQLLKTSRRGWEAAEAMVEADRNALAASTKLWSEYHLLVDSLGASTTEKQIADIKRWGSEQAAAFEAAKGRQLLNASAVADFYDGLSKLMSEKMARVGVDQNALTDAATNHSKAGLQQIAEAAERTYEIAKQHVGDWSDVTIEKLRLTAEAARQAANDFGIGFANAIDPIPAKVDKITESLNKASAAMAVWTVPNLTPEQQRANFEQSQEDERINRSRGHFIGTSTFLNNGINPAEWIFNQFPRRAAGGSVDAGQSVIVGEDHAELFTPSIGGTISPSVGRGATRIIINVPITVQGNLLGTKEELARVAGEAVAERFADLGFANAG